MRLISIEYVVADLDRAIELFVDHCGMTLLERGPHAELDADHAVIDAGSILISLLASVYTGERAMVMVGRSNLTQLVFEAENHQEMGLRLAEAGVSVTADPNSFFITRETVESVFGAAPTLVFTSPSDDG